MRVIRQRKRRTLLAILQKFLSVFVAGGHSILNGNKRIQPKFGKRVLTWLERQKESVLVQFSKGNHHVLTFAKLFKAVCC
jgi:hypothetical protein